MTFAPPQGSVSLFAQSNPTLTQPHTHMRVHTHTHTHSVVHERVQRTIVHELVHILGERELNARISARWTILWTRSFWRLWMARSYSLTSFKTVPDFRRAFQAKNSENTPWTGLNMLQKIPSLAFVYKKDAGQEVCATRFTFDQKET